MLCNGFSYRGVHQNLGIRSNFKDEFQKLLFAHEHKAGFLCYCVDLQHKPGECREGNIIRVGANVLEWLPPYARVKIMFAFPPCTHVAVSGARWFKDKGLGALVEALELFEASIRLAEWTQAPYMIENPVSTVSSYWRRPDYAFDPYEYGGYTGGQSDAYTKKTCLWTGNGFVMPQRKGIAPTGGSRMHLIPPSPWRATLRSVTPRGFAQAVFQANRKAACDWRSGETPRGDHSAIQKVPQPETT